ncbi:MAG: 50S ribosomal protein L21 [Candidatus Margulisiibacteriota bacterium]
MYAIIESGSKQYKVGAGSVIDVELTGQQKDEKAVFDRVLLAVDGTDIKIGTPYLKSPKVSGTVIDQIKDDKVISFKYKRKTGYHRTKGHRQKYTQIKIEDIS